MCPSLRTRRALRNYRSVINNGFLREFSLGENFKKGNKMKIRDIMKNAAIYLGLSSVKDYLDNTGNANAETLKTVDLMTGLSNLVISELASTYVPMMYSETVTATGGKIYFSALSKDPVKITSVKDGYGVDEKFKVFPEYLEIKNGSYEITYQYLPSNYSISEEIGYKTKDVPPSAFSYGLCAEYCITQCRFEEAVAWRKRYIAALEKVLVPKNRLMKGRDFI